MVRHCKTWQDAQEDEVRLGEIDMVSNTTRHGETDMARQSERQRETWQDGHDQTRQDMVRDTVS